MFPLATAGLLSLHKRRYSFPWIIALFWLLITALFHLGGLASAPPWATRPARIAARISPHLQAQVIDAVTDGRVEVPYGRA
jgi:hypothetical protein